MIALLLSGLMRKANMLFLRSPDMYRIADKWTEYAPRVLQIYPELFAEMYGFIIACVQLKLPFTFIKSLVVSTTETPNREGWAYIDALPDDQVCAPPYGKKELPIGLHYCKRYMLGNEVRLTQNRKCVYCPI